MVGEATSGSRGEQALSPAASSIKRFESVETEAKGGGGGGDGGEKLMEFLRAGRASSSSSGSISCRHITAFSLFNV